MPESNSSEPTPKELCPQLEEIFNGLYHVHDAIAVCKMALLYQGADADPDIASMLKVFVLPKINTHLVQLSRIVAKLGGTTDYHEGATEEDEEKGPSHDG
jgi:hypothetical protein